MSQRLSQASQRLSQGSQRQSQGSQRTPRSQAAVPNRDYQEAAREVVRYLLMNDFDKHPIRHTDVMKNVSVLKAHSRSTGPIFDLANEMLQNVFGLELIPLDKSTKQYILVNVLEKQAHIGLTQEVESNLLLLTMILTFIFMVSGSREGGVETHKVHEFLSNVGIDVNENGKHPYFGNVKEVIETLRAQNYLEKDKMDRTDPPKFEYKWGERAYHEFSLRKALKFASEMCNVENVERWAAHYKVVVETEGDE